MKKKIAVILGDGIGPEVTQQSIKVLNTVAKHYQHEFTYEHGLMGAIAIDETGNPLPDETIKICLSSDAILFGAIGTITIILSNISDVFRLLRREIARLEFILFESISSII
jgi:isocitrate/isopropylmalate dehydrogenase